ncbi:hypothetical protein EVAR_82563_1 [Eumeta japonica]|uniref:Uncharacterized protein n=1 Tax=Eumeta variegata TaxID=151549 RepID=A0A4C1UWG0_EUMVA|nr:hypothetical protein EVAR_82563_1 [Eumeta japonica]
MQYAHAPSRTRRTLPRPGRRNGHRLFGDFVRYIAFSYSLSLLKGRPVQSREACPGASLSVHAAARRASLLCSYRTPHAAATAPSAAARRSRSRPIVIKCESPAAVGAGENAFSFNFAQSRSVMSARAQRYL